MAKKLDMTALSKLMKGNASIRMIDYVDGVYANMDFTDADLIFSLKDSLSIEQETPTVEETKITQGDVTIDIDVDAGAITFAANYPTTAVEAFEKFFKKGKDTTLSLGGKTYTGAGFFNTPKETEKSVAFQSQDESQAISFARAKVVAAFKNTDEGQPAYLELTGRVLTNLAEGEGDFFMGVAGEATGE